MQPHRRLIELQIIPVTVLVRQGLNGEHQLLFRSSFWVNIVIFKIMSLMSWSGQLWCTGNPNTVILLLLCSQLSTQGHEFYYLPFKN